MRRVYYISSGRPALGSIVWGTRGMRGLGVTLPGGTTTDRNTVAPFPGNPDTQPGAWPGLVATDLTLGPVSGGCIIDANGKSICRPIILPPAIANGDPGKVPVVVTPTSGQIPPPGTVAAGTTATIPWMDQQIISGIPNKFLLLAGGAALLLMRGKHQ